MGQTRDIGISPVFAVNRQGEIGPVWPAAAGLFGRVFEQDLQLSILEGGGSIQGRRFRRELHIDGFTVGLIGDFEVGPVALGGV